MIQNLLRFGTYQNYNFSTIFQFEAFLNAAAKCTVVNNVDQTMQCKKYFFKGDKQNI